MFYLLITSLHLIKKAPAFAGVPNIKTKLLLVTSMIFPSWMYFV
nr:hypothetical protein [uncultured Niameybacter sp.]